MPLDGVAPAMIGWEAPAHPASRMPASGCSLQRLDLLHPPPDRLMALLRAASLGDDRVCVAAASRPI
jgi:hypothetical protein